MLLFSPSARSDASCKHWARTILVLPKAASLQDYYSADQNGMTLPEEHVAQIMLAGLTGVEKLSPRLCVPVVLEGANTDSDRYPAQTEFEAKETWQTVTLFQKKHMLVARRPVVVPSRGFLARGARHATDHRAATRPRDRRRCRTVGQQLRLKPGMSVDLLGDKFQILTVLPPTGTVDDGRVFAHLHTVQKLAKTGEVVSAIEVMGCCEDAAGDLVPQLAELLPDARVVTISQVVANASRREPDSWRGRRCSCWSYWCRSAASASPAPFPPTSASDDAKSAR